MGSSSSWQSLALCSADRTVYELLQSLREEGVTMLLVEQNAARTIEFCDRCVVLSTGEIRARGTREELRRDPDLLRAYLGRQL